MQVNHLPEKKTVSVPSHFPRVEFKPTEPLESLFSTFSIYPVDFAESRKRVLGSQEAYNTAQCACYNGTKPDFVQKYFGSQRSFGFQILQK